MSDFSYFINEMWEGDNTNNFTTNQIFPTLNELIQWIRGVAFDLSFLIVIIRFDKANGEPKRKIYVLIECERAEKYKKYEFGVQPSIKKCNCPFKLRARSISNGERRGIEGNMWIL